MVHPETLKGLRRGTEGFCCALPRPTFLRQSGLKNRGALAALGDKVGAEEAEGVGGGEVGEGGEGEAAEFG